MTSTPGDSGPRHLVEQLFRAVEAKDRAGVLALVAPDAVLVDPHYPRPTMRGHAEIGAGLDWGFGGMEQMRFPITHYLESADGTGAAVEVATHHTLPGGRDLRFPQAFFFEVRDGLVTRMQAYEPYGPGGVLGAVLGVQHLVYRLRHRRPRG